LAGETCQRIPGTIEQEIGVSEQGNVTGAPEPPQQWYGQPPAPRTRAPSGASQIVVTALFVAIAFGAGWFGNLYVNQNNTISASDPNEQAIFQAYQAISDNYVDKSAVNHQKMAFAAINAMVDSLGDTGHSRFQTPQEVQQENDSLHNQPTVGIGVLLSGGGSKPLRVDEVVPNSAADGHLKPGDVILAVNGKKISGMTFDQVRPLIVGPEGTTVTLTIQRPGVGQPFDVTLTRKPFTLPLVSTYVIPGINIADIQITQFAENPGSSTDNTDAQLRAALQQADVRNAAGIILDLRDNPGGYLDQAVSVASEFIPAGPGHNVYIRRTRTSQQPQPVQPGGLATDKPMVILVNNGTASAAEIVTAAITYNRPTVHVVGEHTFGTDTILTPVPLANGGQILLGTEGWLTPGGVNVRNGGIVPDQVVKLPETQPQITPIVANEEHLTGAQITAGGDTQLQQAIKDLTA
jgi:carboxyl-terminal processing protease